MVRVRSKAHLSTDRHTFFAHAKLPRRAIRAKREVSARQCAAFWPALEAPTTPATRILYRSSAAAVSVYRGCRERTRTRKVSDNAQLPPPPVETSRARTVIAD